MSFHTRRNCSSVAEVGNTNGLNILVGTWDCHGGLEQIRPALSRATHSHNRWSQKSQGKYRSDLSSPSHTARRLGNSTCVHFAPGRINRLGSVSWVRFQWKWLPKQTVKFVCCTASSCWKWCCVSVSVSEVVWREHLNPGMTESFRTSWLLQFYFKPAVTPWQRLPAVFFNARYAMVR